MQYCYNFEDIEDYSRNVYGVCVELDIPYSDGQIVTRNGRQYRVYTCAQNFFQKPDRSWFLGNPSEGFPNFPNETIRYIFSKLEYNFGANLITAPIEFNLTEADYQNFVAVSEGFELYPAPWQYVGIQNTNIFINCLNSVFATYELPLRAIMWSSNLNESGDEILNNEKLCILSRAQDSFTVEFEKDVFGINQHYGYKVDVPNQMIGLDMFFGYLDSSFEDSIYRSYFWRSTDNCPCSRGSYCYTMIHCLDENLNFDFCSTSYIPFDGEIVYQIPNDKQFFRLRYNGENTCICDNFIDASQIARSVYTDCEDAYRVDNIKVRNCITGETKDITINAGYLENSDCFSCPDGFEYNPILNICEKVEKMYVDEPYLHEINSGVISTQNTIQGASFYASTNYLNYPIRNQETPNYEYIDNQYNIVTRTQTIGAPWINNTGSNGRLNIVGAQMSHNNSILGFCFDLDEAKELYIGVGGNSDMYIEINGMRFCELDNLSGFSQNWSLFPFVFNAGVNNIRIRVWGSSTFGVEIYDATFAQLSTATTNAQIDSYLIFSTKDYIGGNAIDGEDPPCEDGFAINMCSPFDVFCERITTTEPLPCVETTFRLENYPCDCFQYVGLNESRGEYSNVLEVYEDCEECTSSVQNCATAERTTAFSSVIKMPKLNFPDRGFKECCYENLVLASSNNSLKEYNDFNSFYYLRQTANDYCHFTLIQLSTGDEFALDNSLYGSFYNFGDISENVNLTYYRLEWKEVLRLLGEGNYQVKKEYSVAGIQFTEYSNTFTLKEYSTSLADGTIRIEGRFNGYVEHLGVDFKGSNFADTVRIKGVFGYRDVEYVQDNIVRRNYKSTQVSMSQENEYDLNTIPLPSCITEYLYDFILFADDLFISDYNSNSHTYKYVNFPIMYEGNNGATYFSGTRNAAISLKFTDRYKNKRKINC